MTLVFRDSWPLVSRWALAFHLQLGLLGATLPLGITFPESQWLRGGAAVLVMSTVWTFFRLRDVRRHLEKRVEQGLQGLLSRGDIESDPEVLERLR